jgi:hypothetical protein
MVRKKNYENHRCAEQATKKLADSYSAFGCGECSKRCALKAHLVMHMRKKHPELEAHFCAHCRQMFGSKDKYEKHSCVNRTMRQSREESVPVTQDEDSYFENSAEYRHSASRSLCDSIVESARETAMNRRSYVHMKRLSLEEMEQAGSLVKPSASFSAMWNVEEVYPCFFCEDVFFGIMSLLVKHYAMSHFATHFVEKYSTRSGYPLVHTCRLCGKRIESRNTFCFHIGTIHGKLKELLPLAAWKALGKFHFIPNVADPVVYDPRIRDKHLGSYFLSLVTNFWVKITVLNFFVNSVLRIRIRDQRWKNPGLVSRIIIPDPQH